MSRYFVENSQIKENTIAISGEDYQHLKKVLRVQKGDTVTVCCNKTDYTVQVEEIGTSSISTVIIERKANLTEPEVEVTLYQGLPKSDKMELIIQKCVELGIRRIVPVITDRCVSRINSDKDSENKLSRWQKISMEAAKQCNRGIVPEIGRPLKFNQAIDQAAGNGLSLIPYEKESAVTFRDILAETSNTKNVSIFIGPEGGFTEQEIQLAENSGIRKMTLGPRILRTETAGLVALALTMYELGDLSNGRNKICSR